MKTAWIGLIGALSGSGVTLVGQVIVTKLNNGVALRGERYGAYVDFLSSANHGMRLAEISQRRITEMKNYNAELSENTAALKAALSEYDKYVESTGDDPDPEVLAELFGKATEFYDKADAIKANSNLDETPLEELFAKIDAYLDAMDRSLSKMQMTSNFRTVRLGTELRDGIRDRAHGKIKLSEAQSRYRDFAIEAKYHLNHPIRAGMKERFRQEDEGSLKMEANLGF